MDITKLVGLSLLYLAIGSIAIVKSKHTFPFSPFGFLVSV